MKKILFLSLMALMVAFSSNVFAQSVKDAKEIAKERKINAKLSEAELNAKVSKEIKKQAKGFAKEGWKVTPGSLPLSKQIERSQRMEYEYLQTGAGVSPKYIMGEAKTIGEIYDAAKKQAVILAQHQIADIMGLEIVESIEGTVGNAQLRNDGASVSKLTTGIKDLVIKKLGATKPIMETYRELPGGAVEVYIKIAYDNQAAKEIEKQALRDELEKQGIELQNKLEDVLGF